MRIFVIRHGQTIINVRKQINGHNEYDLTDEGVKQAKKATEKLGNVEYGLIFCSPLCRARHTANIINEKNIDIIYDERIIERNANSMQYLPISILDKKLWNTMNEDLPYSNAESFSSVFNRVSSFLDEIKKKYINNNIVLVTHGDVCRAIKIYFDGVDNNTYNFEQGNCEIVSYDA